VSRGFAGPALSAWCEQEGITYTIGLPTNARLEALAGPLLAAARAQHQQTGQKVRLAGETAYAADSWPHERRVVYKAEVLAKGPNTRFVVTTRPDPPLVLYNWYVQRGTSEQWIEDRQKRLLCRSAQLPPLLGQSVPAALACRRVLAAGYAAALAHAGRSPPTPARHAPSVSGQDRRLGARAGPRRRSPPGEQSSWRTPLE
jgi:hypothetical protein